MITGKVHTSGTTTASGRCNHQIRSGDRSSEELAEHQEPEQPRQRHPGAVELWRRHTGRGVLAPALVHLATNSGGVLVAWYVLSSG